MISPSGTKIKDNLKYPSLVGNAIFADMDFQNDFVNYYIIRVYKNGKESNDRETDVLCIAAKAFSLSQE